MIERIEAARPSVEAVARDLASLSGTHEAVRDGLEQVRMAYTEMTRLRERHTEADAWLAETDRRLTALRGHATELQGMRPLVDALRGQVDRQRPGVAGGRVVENDSGGDRGRGHDGRDGLDDPASSPRLLNVPVTADSSHTVVTSFGMARLQTPLLGVSKGAIM